MALVLPPGPLIPRRGLQHSPRLPCGGAQGGMGRCLPASAPEFLAEVSLGLTRLEARWSRLPRRLRPLQPSRAVSSPERTFLWSCKLVTHSGGGFQWHSVSADFPNRRSSGLC